MEQIRSVAVIGAGDRGRRFAIRCAEHGFATVLQDVLSSKLRAVQSLVTEAPIAVREHLRFAESIEDAVREADLAIDFVPDELESKLEIFSLLDRMAPPRTILCTPTQLSITDLASCTYRSGRCMALRFEADVPGGKAHVIRGEKADSVAVNAVQSWLTVLGFRVDLMQDPHVPAPAVA